MSRQYSGVASFKALFIYIVIVFTVAYLLDIPLVAWLLPRSYFGLIASIRMWAPFLGSIVVLRIIGVPLIDGLKMLGWRLGKIKYIPVGLAIPYILYGLGVALLYVAGYTPTNPLLVIAGIHGVKTVEAAMIRSAPTTYLIIQLVSAALAGLTVNAVLAVG